MVPDVWSKKYDKAVNKWPPLQAKSLSCEAQKENRQTNRQTEKLDSCDVNCTCLTRNCVAKGDHCIRVCKNILNE